MLGTDQVARLTAAKGNRPPFDVAFFDTPQVLDAVKEGLIVEYPAAKSPNFSGLIPKFRDKWGPKITMQVIGIGYNPKKITTPPKSWDDLWDPKYKGRVGLTALNSQLGIAFLAELNRIKGGSETDFEPAFKALRELLPNVGAIGANLGAFATLWQQEQIDIAPYNFNFVQTLKAKDVPVEFAIPDTGAAGWETSLHLVANAAEPDLAVKYIDLHLDPAIQAQMMKPPYDVDPHQFQGHARGRHHQVAGEDPGRPRQGPRLRLGQAQSAARRADRSLQPRDQERNRCRLAESRLVLPLAALFVAFFVAPLVVLIALSLHGEIAMRTWTLANYAKFFGDPFNYSILWETLLLGVKATLLCLAFGYPIAWICTRASPRMQSVIVFLVILPILTSVVVRTFGWIVILGRQGVINQILLGPGLDPRAAEAALYRGRRRHGAGAGADAADGAADPDRDVEDRSESVGCVARARRRRMEDAVAGDDALVAAGRDRRMHPDLYRLHHRLRDADPDRRRAADLHAAAHLPAGGRRQ